MTRGLDLLLRYILYFSPPCIRRKVADAHTRKELKDWEERCKRTKVCKEAIEEAIDSLDIDGRDVLLHTSMAKIGKLQGGPKWFCDCLFKKIDLNKQTLLVSALPYRGRFKDYLKTLNVFDVRVAPVAMGAINERIAMMPEAKRSIHPTHSIVAIGKKADDYICEHHLDKTPFGIHSPYYKLVKNRGKVVLFGADLDNLTLVHVCEDLLGKDYPNKIYDKELYNVHCVDDYGNALEVETKVHNPIMGIKRSLKPFKSPLLEQGIMKTFPFGESEVSVLDAYQFVVFYLSMMKDGCTMYGKVRIHKDLQNIIDSIITSL